MYEKLFEEK